jgi:hypothetical protein
MLYNFCYKSQIVPTEELAIAQIIRTGDEVCFMKYILLGCASFLCFTLFDLNKLKMKSPWGNLMFGIGGLLLTASAAGILWSGGFSVASPFALGAFFYLLAFLFFFLTAFSLFGALPFKKTYADTNETKSALTDTGMYALCRHPGVLWFFLGFLFLSFASGKALLYLACILWTFLDILHVFTQDVFFFPATIEGYGAYQKTTPFLIPNRKSLRKCVSDFRKRRDPS